MGTGSNNNGTSILFVCNFAYTPNVDAALYFSTEIFTIIFEQVPDVRLFLVGNSPPTEIRDIHGDLYLKNIFIVKDRRYYLYDRVEFNDSLRYADVAEDVAHLSMDLEHHKRKDLQLCFVHTYMSISKDHALERILNFHISYKAFMRAKVSLFQASLERTKSRKYSLKKDADSHFVLGQKYLEHLESKD
jgi:aminoglycoside phosphotransferase family enzyme